MNFSKYHSLSRMLSLILVLCLVSTLFTGCLGSPEETTEPPKLDLETNPSSTTQSTTPPTTEAAEINENTATVISQINIRSSPSTEANIIGTLNPGDRVEISRREELVGINWAYIISPQAGWIVMEYVKMDIPTDGNEGSDTSTPAGGETTPPATTEPSGNGGNTTTNNNTTNIKGVVTASELRIRSEASTDGKIQGAYTKGDVITILETKNGWGRTNKGWVKMDYVNTSGTSTGGNTGNTGNTGNSGNTGSTGGNTSGNGSTTVQFKGIVTASELNVRSSASTEGTKVGSLSFGDRVEILEKSGDWGRTKDGWISLNYVYQDGTKGSNATGGIVTGNNLNVRSGPGTGYGAVGSLNAGDRVDVLEQFTYNGTTWGCIKNGWISMSYVYVDGSGTGNDKEGTITGDNLNIRSGPGTGYGAVGSLNSGDRVTILYEVTVGDTTWGNIDKGWISMDYVDLD